MTTLYSSNNQMKPGRTEKIIPADLSTVPVELLSFYRQSLKTGYCEKQEEKLFDLLVLPASRLKYDREE